MDAGGHGGDCMYSRSFSSQRALPSPRSWSCFWILLPPPEHKSKSRVEGALALARTETETDRERERANFIIRHHTCISTETG